MTSLSDYKPLERVVLPDLGPVSTLGLTLIVGPNSSGKSQLLQDLYHRLSGQPRKLVVATDIAIAKPDYPSLLKSLEDEGYLETFVDDAGTSQLRPLTTYAGTGQAVTQIQTNQAESWHSAFAPSGLAQARRPVEFLSHFGRLLVTALFLDRRLTSLNQVGVIDFLTQPPQQELHALYLNDAARSQLFTELLASFNKAVWPDTSRGNMLCVRVSDEGTLPSAEDRLSVRRMAAYRTIESEGDGLKSYVATCVALLLGRRPICLVDEPEMCLHPPQAYNLGRFIGRYGSSSETATFVATHSSHVLRGVIQTAEKVQIIRLTRRNAGFSAHSVSPEALREATVKPSVRGESVLDGVFSQAVAVVEADGDRAVYEAVWETLGTEFHLDVHFTTVGGTGGIADTCRLYRTLKIPIAVLADLDVMADPPRLKKILTELTVDGSFLAGLLKETATVIEAIRKLPPVIEPDEVRQRLTELAATAMDWGLSADLGLRRALSRIAERLDRMRRLKRGGVAAFPDGLSQRLGALLVSFKSVGLFLVPVGELEEWLAEFSIGASRANKWAWANAAALKVRELGAKPGDVWQFMREVGAFLASPP